MNTLPITDKQHDILKATATRRVENDAALLANQELLLDYDWSNIGDHYTWVAQASTTEILAWCEDVRRSGL